MFGQARVAAGTATDSAASRDVDALLAELGARYGEAFTALLPTCAIYVNGERAVPGQLIQPDDEVAVLPPVSGGS